MRRLYPGWKARAFNITYDDGVTQDIRFVELLNRYGLKGTFNLNSQLSRQEFSWRHPCGMEVRRLPEAVISRLYEGHEVASHTLTHPYMQDLREEEIFRQLYEDRINLEALLGREVKGFAVPFDYYSATIARCAEAAGFEYARMSEFTGHYIPCRDWYHWKTGFYHVNPGLTDYVAGFLNTSDELALCQIVGHSYDLDAESLWGTLELICAAVSRQSDVWSCTHLELVRYLKAMEQCLVTGSSLENRSREILYFEHNGQLLSLAPGEKL